MINIQQFEFNPLVENTYILYDETGECVVIDPGCHNREEQDRLAGFVREKKLKPVLLINTHCHIDHVLGNKFVSDMYGLLPRFHREAEAILRSEEHTSELQSLMRNSYAVFCLT